MKSLISILAVSLALAFTGPAFAGVEDRITKPPANSRAAKRVGWTAECKEVPPGTQCPDRVGD